MLYRYALLAQLDRATGFEPVGREFESLRAYFKTTKFLSGNTETACNMLFLSLIIL